MHNRKPLIILGHSGFIGSHLERVMSTSTTWSVIGGSLPDIDLADPEHAGRLHPFLTPESTLVLAAAVKRQFGDTLERFRENMAIVENLCRLLEARPVERVVFISSAAVYGEETENIDISERTPVNPTSYYGIYKYAAERLLKKVCVANQHTSLVCLRPPLVYGPNDHARTYGPSGFAAAAREGTPITLWGDGTELREFIYVEDLCRVIEFLAGSEFEGELNVVSGIRCSFADILALLREHVPSPAVTVQPRSRPKANNAFDAGKIRAVLPRDFEFTSLRDGLTRILSDNLSAPTVPSPRSGSLDSGGELLVDLGLQPVSNRFLPPGSATTAPRFPLQLRINTDTGLIHLGTPFPIDEVKPRYDWLTYFEPEDHLDRLVEKVTRLPGVIRESTFSGYSFKDDSTLRRFERLGYAKHWRIDPVEDLGVADVCAGIETYQAALTVATAENIRERRGPADVMIVRHVLEHAYDLPGFIQAVRRMVRPGGYIVWELPDCESSLAAGDWTSIWEEHIYYFTNFTFRQLLLRSGFSIVHYESVQYPFENALVAIVQEAPPDRTGASPDPDAVAEEVARAKRFVEALARRRTTVRATLELIRQERGPIAMFGAGHLSVAFLSLMQVVDLISFVVDDNPHKRGLHLPIGALQIVGSEALYSRDVKVCLLGLNPQNQPKVIATHQRFIDQGGMFASIFPGSDLDLERS